VDLGRVDWAGEVEKAAERAKMAGLYSCRIQLTYSARKRPVRFQPLNL
jgi:hypothetical protein